MKTSRTPARVFLLIAAMIAAMLAAAFAPAVTGADRAEALSGSEFDPAYIISDENFFNAGSMSEAQVQAFLEGKEQGCTAANGYPCLKDYRMTTYTRAAVEPGHCGAYVGEVNERASRIIWKVAQACGINPQVLLVTLQKERSLITDLAPDSGDYRISMGYGCPDTSACDSEYFGFYNQVYKAAWQFRQYTQYPAGRRYVVGPSYVQYNPNTACGGTTVDIRNQATANLYLYTPYQPNAAALANLYGVGDGCSAYGNRNFWVFYNNWFGSPTTSANVNPFGNVELVAAEPGAFRVVGWAIDPNTTSPIAVHVYVGSVGTATTADRPRSDVGAAYPGSGDAHGFDVTVAATGSGNVPVCVYAINSGAGANVLLSCTTVTALSGPPVGALTRVSAGSSSIDVAGWAIDPDTVSPISVHVYVDSVGVAVNASTAVDGIDSAYAEYGRNHGFATSIAAAAGTHQVCAYGINVGPGGNSVIGCQTVVVPGGAIMEQGRPPVGALEQVSTSTIGITATGWAIDPDTTSAISVHVYVDDVGKAFTANVTRNDLPAIWADYGTGHGFTAPIPAASGTHMVCAYAINTVGPPTLLGCSSVIVPSLEMPDLGRVPFGNVEAITPGPGTLAVSGWAIDPDTAAPIAVHVYVESAGTAVTADDPRTDVAAVYPAYGSEHGFSWSGTVSAGAHQLCVYAINNGAGGHSLLGCSNVTVPAPPTPEPSEAPIGNLESAVRDGYNVTVSGWALDPDTVNPIDVHVYVGATAEAIRADEARADVAAAHGLGTNHGFSAVLPIAAGPQSVCAYAIDSVGGPPSLIGCIEVP